MVAMLHQSKLGSYLNHQELELLRCTNWKALALKMVEPTRIDTAFKGAIFLLIHPCSAIILIVLGCNLK
jgi:hypothetical protein